ncbi:nucleotide exchange factor GrpE [Exiguobacterium sp. MH3]|uniref:nucleotide exchange factor GrpE n=1 Tax=Exiguobacterium sp. MH3 TaxID=1399115 RepID=UPI0003C40CD9|nr:nucleotide exchange factor GrpE [Exiguobacterium sp. MH3]AHA31552.1 hypothetical protein U719_14735 [Exiguobacterium sp. MH3]
MKSKTRYAYEIYLIESWKIMKIPSAMHKRYLETLLGSEVIQKSEDECIEFNMYFDAIRFFEHTLYPNEPQKTSSLSQKMKTSILSKEYEATLYNRFKSYRQVAVWIQDLAFQQILVDIARTLNAYNTNEEVAIFFQHKDFIEKKSHLFTEGEIKLNQLKLLAEGMLEATKNSHPIIRPVTREDQTLLKRIEEITDEVKKTKRLTFKSAEEIKQLLNDSSEGVDIQEVQEQERQKYINTIIQTYDVLFHLDRMLRIHQPGALANQVTQQLENIEVQLQEVSLEAIASTGRRMDPEYMVGVGTIPSEQANGLNQYDVADEIEKGFKDMQSGKVIRESKVITVLN